MFDLTDPTPTYLNPLVRRDVADPYILKYSGIYWAYGTGIQPDGGAFSILRSSDLVHWEYLGSAMARLEPAECTCYWAPEVSYLDGRFYMYYSFGDEDNMVIRVAVADHPAGPFLDSGHVLTSERFAIDAHLYEDDDGQRYLFYAIDFLEHARIGTGTVRDRLLDLFTLEGRPEPVTRAAYDWQIYDPARAEKGGVRWHTIEGSFVLKHKGRYFQMFSGGNWQNLTYGVSYAVADRIDQPGEWRQVSDGEQILPVLRTVPGEVIGPGHNSVVRGPDNRQLFCIYHRWGQTEAGPEPEGRLLAIDRLDWVGHRLLVLGPSTTPQPMPIQPALQWPLDLHTEGLPAPWQAEGGQWRLEGGRLVQSEAKGNAQARVALPVPNFCLEVSAQPLDQGKSEETRRYGVALLAKDGAPLIHATLAPDQGVAEIVGGSARETAPLSAAWPAEALHLFRLDVDGAHASLALDGHTIWSGTLAGPAATLALLCDGATAFMGLALTPGWEALWMSPAESLEALGWQPLVGGAEHWHIADDCLQATLQADQEAIIGRGPAFHNYELVVTAQCLSEGSRFGFVPALTADGQGPRLWLAPADDGWALVVEGQAERPTFPLPAGFDPSHLQHFRFRKEAGRLTIAWEAEPLGALQLPDEASSVALSARGEVAFDMVRLTMIP